MLSADCMQSPGQGRTGRATPMVQWSPPTCTQATPSLQQFGKFSFADSSALSLTVSESHSSKLCSNVSYSINDNHYQLSLIIISSLINRAPATVQMLARHLTYGIPNFPQNSAA